MDGLSVSKSEWTLSAEALARFLSCLDPDSDRAGEKYESLRLTLMKFFDWRGAHFPEELADETINRVIRKIDEGEAIRDFQSYSATVARFVISEYRKRRKTDPLEEATVASYNDYYKESESSHIKEVRQECFDSCLSKLAVSDRELILEYYKEERDKKIKSRQEIAKRMGVEVNALRIRTHRIRKTLEPCVKGCVRQKPGE